MKIKYIGFEEATGYGIAASLLVDALRAENVIVDFLKIISGVPEIGGHRTSEVIYDCTDYDTIIVHTVPEYYPYWLQEEKSKNNQVKVWGYTAWETDQIPEHWLYLVNLMDGVFVPSNWNKEVFKNCGVNTRIEVLPHISEFQGKTFGPIMNESLQKTLDEVRDSFLFYSIGVWNERKAPELLLHAFLKEFSKDEPVALVHKTGSRDWTTLKRNWKKLFRKEFGLSADAFRKTVASFKNSARIYQIGDDLTGSDISALHKRGDCFISLTRGEGWGMGAYEAAWFGNAVAITGYGGVLDYLPSAYANLIGYQLVPVNTVYGQKSYTKAQKWAKADVKSARKIMRQIYEERNLSQSKGDQLSRFVRDNFSTKSIANKCLQILKQN